MIKDMPGGYYKFRATCDLATAAAQIGAMDFADKYIRRLDKNVGLRKKAECSKYIAVDWLSGAESTAKSISEGNERREALCNVAKAYARDQSWDKAYEIVAIINDREQQDKARAVLAIELARAGLWERASTTFDAIHKNSDQLMVNQRVHVLRSWADFLAEPGNREQREKTAHSLTDGRERACLLMSVVDKLAQLGQYIEHLHLIQQAWLQARTKDDCLYLFAIVQALILRAPEMGAAFYNAFTWVNTFLSQ